MHCLFCGKNAVENEKITHPDRSTSSISHPDSHPNLKNRLLEICRRPDRLDSNISHIVRGRLMATNDVVADKCRYHRNCYKDFCRECIPSDEAPVKRPGRPTNVHQARNFERLCEWLEIETQLYTVSELHEKMVQISKGTDVYTSNQYLKQQLQVRYGDRIFLADMNGKSDVVCFKNVAKNVATSTGDYIGRRVHTVVDAIEEHVGRPHGDDDKRIDHGGELEVVMEQTVEPDVPGKNDTESMDEEHIIQEQHQQQQNDEQMRRLISNDLKISHSIFSFLIRKKNNCKTVTQSCSRRSLKNSILISLTHSKRRRGDSTYRRKYEMR